MLKPAADATTDLGRFRTAEGGAMTVEWVAIAAAVVVGAVAIGYAVLDSLDPVAAQVGATIATSPGTDGGGGQGTGAGEGSGAAPARAAAGVSA